MYSVHSYADVDLGYRHWLAYDAEAYVDSYQSVIN